MIMADETATGVSGCSTDGSVRLIKEIEKAFNVTLFDRQLLGFIVKDKVQFEMVEVQVGNAENGFTEVILDEKYINDTFVIKGAYNLLMKMKNTSDE